MYKIIDQLIIDAILQHQDVHSALDGSKAVAMIASETRREPYRVIDGRLKALKRQKRIVFVKSTIGRKAAWHVLSHS